MQAAAQTLVVHASVHVAFFSRRDRAFEPGPRIGVLAETRQAITYLMQAATQARVVHAPVHVARFSRRHGLL